MAKRKSNAVKFGLLGALVGGMQYKLNEHEENRRLAADELKQRRLQQIQIEAEQRANAEWERRNSIEEVQYEKRDTRDHGQALELDDRRAIREEARDERIFERQKVIQEDAQAHSAQQQANSQAFTAQQNLVTHKQALERIAAQATDRNESGQPISFVARHESGAEQYVTLQPGQRLGRGWSMLTTAGARSPMPSASKDDAGGAGGYQSPRARGGAQQALLPQGPKPQSWDGWSGTEID